MDVLQEYERLARRGTWLSARAQSAQRPQDLIRLSGELEQHAREALAFLEAHRGELVAGGYRAEDLDAQAKELWEDWLGD